MNAITHAQIQELVMRLPVTKLSLAYHLLIDLADRETDELSPEHDLMLLPLDQRRQLMAQQAEQMIAHYHQGISGGHVTAARC